MKCFDYRKIAWALLSAVLFLPVSCMSYSEDLEAANDRSRAILANGLVTVKTLESGTVYFQLDETTTLQPVSWKNYFGKEVRALVNYTELSVDSELFTKAVRVNGIDSVRTKKAYSLAFRNPDEDVADSPIELIDDWLTVCEDGYMNVHYAAQYGSNPDVHELNLGIHPDKPFDLYLFLDRKNDSGTAWYDEVVAFDITELIPCDEGEVVSLTLHWDSNDGSKTLKFKCKPHRITKL